MAGIKVFWHQSENFGDKLTPYILDKLGVEYEYTEKGINEEHYILCGSILPACNEHSIIWGAGIAQQQEIKQPKKICAVRGIITYAELKKNKIEAPEIFGDPAIILPLLYNPKKEKQRETGIIHHMADYNIHGQGHDITKSVEETIDYILESERILTSSLHALITAFAYNIEPIVLYSENVIGQKMKVSDFMKSPVYNLNTFIKSCPIPEINSLL